MEKSRKRENISPKGGFHDAPRYVHPSIHDGGGEPDLARATHVFGYFSFSVVLTGSLVVIGTSSSCIVLLFGRPGYTRIAVAAHM